MREEVNYELSFQVKRGLMNFARNVYKLPLQGDNLTVEDVVEHGLYTVGTPDEVASEIKQAWEKSGGFGQLLMLIGKSWGTRATRERSMRGFMEHVAPQLRDLPAVA